MKIFFTIAIAFSITLSLVSIALSFDLASRVNFTLKSLVETREEMIEAEKGLLENMQGMLEILKKITPGTL